MQTLCNAARFPALATMLILSVFWATSWGTGQGLAQRELAQLDLDETTDVKRPPGSKCSNSMSDATKTNTEAK